MIIRNATLHDIDELVQIERECFPPKEAAKKEDIIQRVHAYPNHFWLICKDDKIISFINGFATDIKDLSDEMYENARLHDESGDWQMIFGVNTRPEYRNQGHASMLIEKMIESALKEKRLGLVLTCKKELVEFYSRFGFTDEGISTSQHGGAVWHQMRLKF